MTQAVIYLRQSKDREDNRDAITRQRQDCERLAADRGWTVTRVYDQDNDKSASEGKVRPDYVRMLEAADRHEFDVIVCWHMDRLTRSLADLVSVIPRLEKSGVRVATVSGDLDLTTDAGRLVARILASVAQGEVERKSARQKRAALQAAERGEPRLTRIRAFGFEPDGVTHHATEADALRRVYQSLLSGRTLVGLCRDLAAEGFLTPAGKPFNHNGIKSILLNSRNAGIRSYTTKINGRNVTREIGPAQWEPIVDLDTFRTAESILNDPRRREGKDLSGARRWLLGGLATCGECANHGKTSAVKVNYKGSNGHSVRQYQCRDSAHVSRSADWVDKRVTERVIGRLSQPDAVELLVDIEREGMAELRQEHDRLAQRLDQLADAFADGAIDNSQLRKGTERLRGKIADLESRMAHVDRAPILADLVGAEDVRAAWDGLPLDRQRAVIDLLYDVVIMKGKMGRKQSADSVVMRQKDQD
jgi:site-specific DNA recombinase